MRFIFLTLLLLIPFILCGQEYQEFDTEDLFLTSGATITIDEDSIYSYGQTYPTAVTDSSQIDTLTSYKIPNDGGGNDWTIYAGIDDTLLADTTKVYVEFGYWTIETGWNWVLADSITALNTDVIYDVGGWSLASTRVVSVFGVRLRESSAQDNKLWARAIKFKWR